VHALFDLCTKSDNFAPPVSSDVVLTALNGLMQRVVRYAEASPLSDRQLRELESLVGRVDELGLSPALQTVECLWLLQQHHWQAEGTVTRHVERTVSLLQSWWNWAHQDNTLLWGHPPPTPFLCGILRTVALNQTQMSTDIWNLYTTMASPSVPRQQLCRKVYSYVLEILAYSDQEWSSRQCQVLQAMTAVGSQDPEMLPVESELARAMKASASAGLVADAAWLSRRLVRQTDSTMATQPFFLEALLNCPEAGSLLYMERLVFAASETQHEDLIASQAYEMLLKKCSMAQTPGSGRRAERIFHRMLKYFNATQTNGWRLDAMCVNDVVAAYLQEHSFSLAHVLKADRFVRRCVRDYGLHMTQNGTEANVGKYCQPDCRLFDRVLEAYGSLSADVGNNSTKILKRADELFRFFLIQHRKGRVTAEEPDGMHLLHIVRLWNRNSSLAIGNTCQKSAEYSKLMKSLPMRKILNSCPESDDVRQLLERTQVLLVNQKEND
jgi:hypothetical protein